MTTRFDLAALPIAIGLCALGLFASGCGDLPPLLPYVDLGGDRDAGPVDARVPPPDGEPGDGPLIDPDDGVPPPERCDGVDNDLDGTIDEDIAEVACQDGVGRCAFEGTSRCRDGGMVCEGAGLEPRDETCDGTDDDCDGATDEGFILEDRCTAGLGECFNTGLTRCNAAGDDVECSVAPLDRVAADICDGLDNDCDGATDEAGGGVEGPLTMACVVPNTAGPCLPGTQRCIAVAGQMGLRWSACTGLEAVNELCNDFDDDCDGSVDEDYPEVGEECPVVGAEAGCDAGTWQCSEDGNGVDCVPLPEQACDGIDDDCDGSIDEGDVCGRLMVNSCRAWIGWTSQPIGPQVGEWGSCPRQASQGPELSCDGAPDPDGPTFVDIPVGGDVDAMNDRLGTSLRCAPAGAEARMVRLAQAGCAIYLGLGAVDDAPDGEDAWGRCPDMPSGTTADGYACTSGDELFRPMIPTLDLNRGAALGVAFICSPEGLAGLIDDLGIPAGEQAEALARFEQSVEIMVAWADSTVPANARDWATVCAPGGDGNDLTACASSQGDGLFHAFEFGADFDAGDRLAIGVRVRDVP